MVRVIYDLEKTSYKCKHDNMEFYFSSVFNLKRFESNYKYYLEEENNKLKAKYHVNIKLNDYLLVSFYKKIEKRGFKVLIYLSNDIIRLSEDYMFIL